MIHGMRGGADYTSESDALHAYLRAISKLPRLTAEEERELGRAGDQDALRRLVEGNPGSSSATRNAIAASACRSSISFTRAISA
jgi:hypothetical protein